MNRILFVVGIAFLTLPGTTFSETNIDPAQKYAWGENIGWTNWRDAHPTNSGVVVNASYLSGYVWAENAGWINVGNGPASGPSYANLDGTDFGVNIAPSGDLSGFAWSENGGWVNFDTSTHSPNQARFDADDWRFRGWVWSENAGWINLDDATNFLEVVKAVEQSSVVKNRYITLARNKTVPTTFDIRLTLTSTLVAGVDPGQIGSQWWANAPDADCLSIATSTQPFTPPNWSSCLTIHVTGCPIIPTSTYDIVAISGGVVEAVTQLKPGFKWWGDCVGFFTGTEWTPPNGSVNFDDVTAAIKTFQDPDAINATHVSVTDVHPNLPPLHPNRLVNIDDVAQILQGFQGNPYPGFAIENCP